MSESEDRLDGVMALVKTALPDATVGRNQPKPEVIPDGGFVNILDGAPVLIGTEMSPLTYLYSHDVMLEIAPFGLDGDDRSAVLATMLSAIEDAVQADRHLGGLVDFMETGAPDTDNTDVFGIESERWAAAPLTLHYATTRPFG